MVRQLDKSIEKTITLHLEKEYNLTETEIAYILNKFDDNIQEILASDKHKVCYYNGFIITREPFVGNHHEALIRAIRQDPDLLDKILIDDPPLEFNVNNSSIHNKVTVPELMNQIKNKIDAYLNKKQQIINSGSKVD